MKVKKLLHDRVLVKLDPTDDTTDGGIVLPDKAAKRQQYGTVVAIGPGTYDNTGNLVPMQVQPEDRVMIEEFGDHDITLDGHPHRIVRDRTVIMVIDQ